MYNHDAHLRNLSFWTWALLTGSVIGSDLSLVLVRQVLPKVKTSTELTASKEVMWFGENPSWKTSRHDWGIHNLTIARISSVLLSICILFHEFKALMSSINHCFCYSLTQIIGGLIRNPSQISKSIKKWEFNKIK